MVPKAIVTLMVQAGVTLVMGIITGFARTPHSQGTLNLLKSPKLVLRVSPNAQHLVDVGSRDEILLQFYLPFPDWVPTSLCDFFVPSVRVS